VFVMSTPNRNGWVRADIYFHRFTDLKMNSGRYNIASPSFSCLGRNWTVEVNGYITGNLLIRLQPRRYENIVAGISINNVSYWKGGGELSIKGEDMLGNLEEGAMWIEVRMRMTKCSFIPDSSACRTLHGLFMDKESADVVFKIKGDQTTSFYAHRLILRHAAPQLADLCVMEGSRLSLIFLVYHQLPLKSCCSTLMEVKKVTLGATLRKSRRSLRRPISLQ
jgi:hypothetical protein